MSICRSCLLRLTPASNALSHRSSSVGARALSYTSRRGDEDELAKAKARAWYLDPTPSTPARAEAGTPSSTKPIPRFTTFDPQSTRSDIDAITIEPLPDNATSPILIKLHDHLTVQSDSVDAGSVRFLHAPSARLLRSQAGLEENEALIGESGGTNWEWVVICQVRGRGRGVLNRAEKEIRKWMRETLGKRTRSRTASREESDTDWSMVYVGEGVCVNLFTAEGKERWNLEELWASSTGREGARGTDGE